MKKLFLIGILIILIVSIGSTEILANSPRDSSSKNYLTFSWFFKPASLGAKLRIANNTYATGNIDYRDSAKDLEFQAGAVYLFPPKILIFKLYAGGGYQFSRNEGFQYPYISVGTNFLFLFSEIVYPMKSNLDPKYRAGFSIKF
jgi:hypothetical protein